MNAGVRLKLFVTLLGLIVSAGMLSGMYLERRLRNWFDTQLTADLESRVAMARDLVELAPEVETFQQADAVADRLGQSSLSRVTIIRRDGVVIGDSKVATFALLSVANHAQRPEFIQAMEYGMGTSRRYSSTVDTPMLYVAVPYERKHSGGVVRVAMALSDVELAVGQLRLVLLVAGAVGLVLAVFVSGLASHLASRPLRRLVSNARQATTTAEGSRLLPVASNDELGRLAGSFNALVHELDATLKNLARERDRLSTIVTGMSEAVIALDAEHCITLINPAARDLLALPPEVEGRRLPDLMETAELGQWLNTGLSPDSSATETELPMPRGRTALVRAASLKTTGGLVLVMLDITKMRRLEEIRRDFVASVSHELRTPVSVIQANAETLLDGAMHHEEHGPKFLDAILRNAQRLARLVGDLLDLSRIESGHFPFEPRALGVAQAVHHAVAGLQVLADQKGLTISVDVPDPLRAQADANALEQVLTNLIENAVKYTPGGGKVTVEAEAVRRGATEQIQIAIGDNGPGIAPQHRARIFERFYRVDTGRSRAMGGTGLGLAIVKHLVNGMRGTIELDDSPEGGARFRVWLPQASESQSQPQPIDGPVAGLELLPD